MDFLSQNHYRGCIMGGAIGDCLGAPLEFMSSERISSVFGENGIDDYVEFKDRIGRITDDTQMTLFTAEGLLRSLHRYILKGISGAHIQLVYDSYKHWLYTQDNFYSSKIPEELSGGWLLDNELLYKRRAPGITCLQALASGVCGSIEEPINKSKGCGGVMRVAPVGLIIPRDAFEVGAQVAAITHGHPSGYLSAGAFAFIISRINQGDDLMIAIEKTKVVLKKWTGHEEVLSAIQKATDVFERTKDAPSPKDIESLGGGWTGEEALSIALYCSLVYPNDFEKAVLLSIHHSGDSDSTGSMTGNLVGLILGMDAISKRWTDSLELSDCIVRVADDLYEGVSNVSTDALSDGWRERYRPY